MKRLFIALLLILLAMAGFSKPKPIKQLHDGWYTYPQLVRRGYQCTPFNGARYFHHTNILRKAHALPAIKLTPVIMNIVVSDDGTIRPQLTTPEDIYYTIHSGRYTWKIQYEPKANSNDQLRQEDDYRYDITSHHLDTHNDIYTRKKAGYGKYERP